MARIVLGVSASVAIYKACDLASKLAQHKHAVRAVLTPRAARLVSPQLFEALTGERASTDEFDASRSSAMEHIDLARWADLLIVAPASADLIARLAHGQADDLVATLALALASTKPKLIAPAMNPHMLDAAPVKRNLATLAADGWKVIAPGSGHLACGDEGRGRMPEPAELADLVRAALDA